MPTTILRVLAFALLLILQFVPPNVLAFPFFYNCEDDDDGPTIIQFSAPPPFPYPPMLPPPPAYPMPPPPLGPLASPPPFPLPPPPVAAAPLFAPPMPYPYPPYPTPGFTCTIISPDRKKRAAAGPMSGDNPYFEQFQDEYGVGKERIGQKGDRGEGENGGEVVEGQSTAKVKEYEAEFRDEYGVGKDRLAGPGGGNSAKKVAVGKEDGPTNGQNGAKDGKGTGDGKDGSQEKRPNDKFAPWTIERRGKES